MFSDCIVNIFLTPPIWSDEDLIAGVGVSGDLINIFLFLSFFFFFNYFQFFKSSKDKIKTKFWFSQYIYNGDKTNIEMF